MSESNITDQPQGEEPKPCCHFYGMQYTNYDGWEPVTEIDSFEKIWSRKSTRFNFCPKCGERLNPQTP